ncbi:hypothetical protein FAF44_09295 [Nonomuraea sp. MG754425]|uniref:hypothetical protein n=1 Tax=Nonomuraea sp. MG754425 TaxID=2570319 RepID=UPI001F39A2B3|nr:hypothetical protein [Nonomuraea sp. MG754425]MCF6468578.1 hypothetical protein [Nonomuraea sp. MG754425]
MHEAGFVDLEEEILGLKLRMQAIEQLTRPGDEEHVTAANGRAPVQTAVSGGRVTDDLEALNVEIGGLRWQVREYHTATHTQVQEQLDDIRTGMHSLEFKLDQLLRRYEP